MQALTSQFRGKFRFEFGDRILLAGWLELPEQRRFRAIEAGAKLVATFHNIWIRSFPVGKFRVLAI